MYLKSQWSQTFWNGGSIILHSARRSLNYQENRQIDKGLGEWKTPCCRRAECRLLDLAKCVMLNGLLLWPLSRLLLQHWIGLGVRTRGPVQFPWGVLRCIHTQAITWGKQKYQVSSVPCLVLLGSPLVPVGMFLRLGSSPIPSIPTGNFDRNNFATISSIFTRIDRLDSTIDLSVVLVTTDTILSSLDLHLAADRWTRLWLK